jgi:hypothetical protein
VDVIFDAAGLATGTYTGTLCVESNDPVNAQVRLALSLVVTEEVEYENYLPIMLYEQNSQPEASTGSPAPLSLGVAALPVAMAGMWVFARPGRQD